MSTATCDFRFSLQNRYAEDSLVDKLTNLGISNCAVTISGSATLSERDIERGDFIGAKPEEIRTKLTDFLEEHELPRGNDLVILDMEPKGIAPVRLGEFTNDVPVLRDLVAAYRRRIRVARQVLRQTKRPGLKLALYQVIVPDGKGQSTSEFDQRMLFSTASARCPGRGARERIRLPAGLFDDWAKRAHVRWHLGGPGR